MILIALSAIKKTEESHKYVSTNSELEIIKI